MSDRNRLPALDTLRALAILWVFAYHSIYLIKPADPQSLMFKLAHFGNAGVDLFFVLSGYLIARIVLSELRPAGRLDLGRFWWRRWMRTLPAYYVMLAVTIAVGSLSPERWSWGELPSYLAFIQNYSPRWPSIRFSWSWSLCVEEWFYLILPIATLTLLRLGRPPVLAIRQIAIIALLGSVLGRLSWLAMAKWGIVNPHTVAFAVYCMTHLRLDGLAVGIYLATLPKPSAGPILILACVAALVALAGLIVVGNHVLIFHLELQEFEVRAVIFGILIYASTGENCWSRLSIPGMRPIAELSYAMYLTHYTALEAAIRALPTSPGWAKVAAGAALTMAASLAMRHLVELPALRLRDRIGPGRRPAPAEAAPRPEDHAALATSDQRSP